MSYQGNSQISYMVRCGWCSALINTATLNAEIETVAEQIELLEITPSKPDKSVKPHTNCPRCGHILYVKGVKTV